MVAWFIFYQRGRQPEPMLCLTDDCRKHADHLSVHVNYSVPPCQDFKQHICSAWKPPIGHSDVFSTTRSIDTLIWGKSFGLFLDKAENSNLVAKKPRAMFHACIAKRMDSQSEADGFVSFLDQRNLSWPKLPLPGRSALGVLIYLALHWRQYFWLTLRFQTERGANSGKIRILMTSGNKDVLIYLATNYMRLQLSNNYHRYWMMHYKTMYGKRAPVPSAEQIDASGSVFARVLKLLLDAIMKVPKQPLQTRLSQIGRYTGRLTSSHWMEQLNVQVSDRFAFTGEEEVLVSDRLLLETIGQLFGQYNDSELIREMTWEFVQVHIAVVDAHGVAMTLGGRDNVEGYVRGFCAFIVDEIYRTLLDSLYVALRRTSDDGRLITVGLGSIIQKAIDKVKSSWLSDDSKRTVLEKYGAMRIGVWPPDILDESVARAYRCFPTRGKTFVLFWIAAQECRWRITGTTFERNTSSVYGLTASRLADYDYLTNTVHMAVTALTDPLYYTRGTRAMFYAGIGFLFATQMMKVQDMTGIKVLPNGSIVDRPWLETPDLGRFEDKRRCLGARAEGYLVPAISALEVTYAVFTEDGGVNFTRHPITNNMTEAQVFFSTVCEMTCHTEKNHWIPLADCNVLVQNSRHFSDAYHCPPGSPMNPKRKCGFFD
ncbi:endothelin-converting enzyme 1-like [Haemaphysalis longicornis]